MRGPLSEASRRQTATIVGGLFEWLVGVEALRVNPFQAVPRKRTATGPGSQRRLLEAAQVAAVFDAMVDISYFAAIKYGISLRVGLEMGVPRPPNPPPMKLP